MKRRNFEGRTPLVSVVKAAQCTAFTIMGSSHIWLPAWSCQGSPFRPKNFDLRGHFCFVEDRELGKSECNGMRHMYE